jgi:hypothetical protein
MRVPRSQRRAWLRYPDESAAAGDERTKRACQHQYNDTSAAAAASHWRYALRES